MRHRGRLLLAVSALALLLLPVLAPPPPSPFVARVAEAQTAVPAHQHVAMVGPTTGATRLLPNRARSLLILVNDSTATIYCTVDDTNAAVNTGWRLNASGGSIVLDKGGAVPRGSLRCVSATADSRLLFTEGQ